ncbi:MAG: CAP domain-containing protein [Chloroflexi bacterium]|nr:CAP domain-containing protein [Chloroflexota bacterium]
MSRISPRRFVPILIASLVMAASFTPLAAEPAAARDGADFVSVANRYRAVEAGLGPVGLHSVIDRIAVERGNQLAADRKLGHDFDYLKVRLAQEGICWQQLGEIVAYNYASESKRVEEFVNQWFKSPGHWSIMSGTGYTHAGGSWTTGSNGTHYGVMVFVKVCGAATPVLTTSGFTDIGASKFKTDIVWLAANEITVGCSATKFCPEGAVNRDQMATFLSRAMDLSSTSKDYFLDDGWNKHHASINSVARAGVTRGCDTNRYCPSGKVTRAQMASFLDRALNLPGTSRDYFGDDNTSIHEGAINRLAAAGITVGCAGGRYCPGGTVTREQMAAFLRRAFD